MTKREMMTAIAQRADVTIKGAEKTTNAFLEILVEELQAKGKASVAGFGTFEVRHRKERIGRNPLTGQAAVIPASKPVAFKAGKHLKEEINR